MQGCSLTPLLFPLLGAFLWCSLPSAHAKKPYPEALPSPLSGLNSVGQRLGEDLGNIGPMGGSWSQVWVGAREPVLFPRIVVALDQVTATIGSNAFLPCSVQHLGDRTVTWMRQRDLHILTAGSLTYSADERFRVLHPDNSPDWTLHIKVVTPTDAGMYECQVNSDPKLSRVVALHVKEPSQLDDPDTFVQTNDPRHLYPKEHYEEDYDTDDPSGSAKKYGRAKGRKNYRRCRTGRRNKAQDAVAPSVRIEGRDERYIQEGSVLALTCLVIHQKRRAPAHLLWFRGTQRLDYNSPRGGVSVQTEKMASRTLSRLMISEVQTEQDSGEYSCSPTDLPTAVVTVHVQRGQHHAAVHQSVYSTGQKSSLTTRLLVASLILLATLGTAHHPEIFSGWG